MKMLQAAGADDYIPVFARNRITEEVLLQITDGDLKQVGSHKFNLSRQTFKKLGIFFN